MAYSKKTVFALIPARSGSKRLPHKNKRLLCGKPLICWTIESALGSRYIDTVCVSTDDADIIELARAFQAEAPFLRPAALSTENATSASVMTHALDFYKTSRGKEFDCLVLLQPTSPLRTAEDIDRAVELLFSSGAKAIVSVCPESHSPLLTMNLPEDFSLTAFIDGYNKHTAEEKSRVFYRINGALYICRAECFAREQSFFPGEGSYAYLMPADRSIDIDTEFDFFLAESLMKKNAASSSNQA